MFFKAVSIGNYVCHFCKSISCQLWGISDARLQHMAKFLVPYLRPTKSQLSGVGPSNVFKNHTPYISFFFPPNSYHCTDRKGKPCLWDYCHSRENQKRKQRDQSQGLRGGVKEKGLKYQPPFWSTSVEWQNLWLCGGFCCCFDSRDLINRSCWWLPWRHLQPPTTSFSLLNYRNL